MDPPTQTEMEVAVVVVVVKKEFVCLFAVVVGLAVVGLALWFWARETEMVTEFDASAVVLLSFAAVDRLKLF